MEDRFKSRAWDFINGRMVYSDDGWYLYGKDGCYEYRKDCGEYIDNILIKKDYGALMQCSGLKNSKLIYDGDIVEYQQLAQIERYKVIFKNGCFGIINIAGGNLANFLTLEEFIIEMKNDLKVIGNKFNNPELITKGDN